MEELWGPSQMSLCTLAMDAGPSPKRRRVTSKRPQRQARRASPEADGQVNVVRWRCVACQRSVRSADTTVKAALALNPALDALDSRFCAVDG